MLHISGKEVERSVLEDLNFVISFGGIDDSISSLSSFSFFCVHEHAHILLKAPPIIQLKFKQKIDKYIYKHISTFINNNYYNYIYTWLVLQADIISITFPRLSSPLDDI